MGLGLYGACQGGMKPIGAEAPSGHRHLAEFMIIKGATSWNWGLPGACRAGHRDLAELMILKGADYHSCSNQQHCHQV